MPQKVLIVNILGLCTFQKWPLIILKQSINLIILSNDFILSSLTLRDNCGYDSLGARRFGVALFCFSGQEPFLWSLGKVKE